MAGGSVLKVVGAENGVYSVVRLFAGSNVMSVPTPLRTFQLLITKTDEDPFVVNATQFTAT